MFDRISAAGLLSLLALYFAVIHSQWSTGWFGYPHDDSIYFSSAEALARGEGYVMPSVPGEPIQTKYPILYPLLLSFVWKWSPNFPDNLYLAHWVNGLFGCSLLLGIYLLFRQLGAGRRVGLALTTVFALHPAVLNLSGLLLSDLPFLAIAVWAAVLGHYALSIRSTSARFWPFWMVATACGVLAIMTRSMGVAVVAGISSAAVMRKAYRAAALHLVAGTTCFAVGMLWAGLSRHDWAAGFESPTGYGQTMLFYTSYLEFWKLSVPDWPTLWSQVTFNLVELVKTPAALCFLVPAGRFDPWLWQVLALVLSVGIVKGLLRKGTSHGWHVFHGVLIFYLPLVLLWNYTLMERFMLLFLPLFLWGALGEIQGIATLAAENFRKAAPWGERIAAALLLSLIGMVVTCTAVRYSWQLPAARAQGRERREALAEGKLEAYAWIRAETSPTDRFVCYDDVLVHFYTGRQALRPIATSTAAFFRQDKSILEGDLAKLSDTARTIGARYWLVAPDDYHLEAADRFLREETERLLSSHPVVFVGRHGQIKIHDISELR